MKNIKYMMIIICSCIVLLLSGCTNTTKIKDNVKDESLNIVTSFYPMYIATANIIDGVEDVTLECLASPEVGCLHDYQLTVKDMMTLEDADVFVINGGGMESFLDKAISAYPKMKIVNASEEILESNLLEHEHEENDEHEDEHEHGHEHNHGDENPHVWVSIDLHIQQIEKITQELIKIDNKNKEKYENNSNQYIAELKKLSEKMHNELDNLPNKDIITFHEAFEYFAKEFGLNVLAVIEREPGTSPSARDVANIIDIVREYNVNAVFVEPQYSKTAANTISNETDTKVYELDPATSGTFEKNAYIQIMEKNLEVLKEALK